MTWSDDIDSNELERYVRAERNFLRERLREFARRHPECADTLQVDSMSLRDPDAQFLLEGVAALNGRIQCTLADDFSLLAQALLQNLYPHVLRPFPSAMIVQFQLDRAACDKPGRHVVPRGAQLETRESPSGISCRFRTAYDVDLYPLRIASAEYDARPKRMGSTPWPAASSVVRLELASRSAQATLSALRVGRLRFHLHGQAEDMYGLYESLVTRTLGLTIKGGSSHDAPRAIVERERVKTVGFGRDETLLPVQGGQRVGYHLLTEFFAFKPKFLFLDVEFDPEQWDAFGRAATLEWHLDRQVPELARIVRTETFQLGCTPAINLFPRTVEPLRLDETVSEYRLMVDACHPRAYEIHSVDRVAAWSDHDGGEIEYAPFFSIRHDDATNRRGAFWHSTLRPAATEGDEPPANDVWLSLVDLDFSPRDVPDRLLTASTTCTNGDLPSQLPWDDDSMGLQLDPPDQTTVVCLSRPTRTVRPHSERGLPWRLVSHLSLNHLAFTDAEVGAKALREILRLHAPANDPVAHAAVDAIQTVTCRRAVERVAWNDATEPVLGMPGVCQGVQVEVRLNARGCLLGEAFLLASVLDRFLGDQASLNSFTKLVVTTESEPFSLHPWPPRNGDRTLP